MNELTPRQRAQILRRQLQAQRRLEALQEAPEVIRDPNGEDVALRPPRADAPGAATTDARTDAQRLGERVGGAVDAAAPVVEDVVRSGGSGLVRGAVGLAEIPSLPGRAMDWALARGAEFIAGDRAPEWTQRPREFNAESPPPARALAESVPVVNQALQYSPQTTAGEYAQTVGEFVPGAALGPGGTMGNVIRYGVIPGAASETAGQFTEGTAAEPYARAAAAIGTGILAARPSGQARPVPRADSEDARFAEILMRNGVRPTVGQTSGSGALRRMEGTASFTEDQLVDFTRAAMRTTGSTAGRATEIALRDASRTIVNTMDDAVRGVSVAPTPQMAQQADDVVRLYQENTAQANVIPAVRNIADEIIDAATSPGSNPIELSTLRRWRSRLGRLMQSQDSEVREAAYGLRSVIDDATEASLQAAGRTEDVARLATAREQYRNWLAVSDAATRAGAENGIVSPTVLHGAVVRTQGRRNVAVGNTTNLGELSRAGAALLRPMPSVEADSVRRMPLQYGAGGVGAVAGQQMGGDPLTGAIIGGVVGSQLPGVSERVLRSNALQNLLMDPSNQAFNALRTIPGVTSN